MLKDIVAMCDSMWMDQIYKAIYLGFFFLFLRISNQQFTGSNVLLVKLPLLSHSLLYPVSAVKNLLMLTPGDQDTPLFQIKNAKAQFVPLTDTQTRRNFAQVLIRLRFAGLWNVSPHLQGFRYLSSIQFKCITTKYPESWHLDV